MTRSADHRSRGMSGRALVLVLACALGGCISHAGEFERGDFGRYEPSTVNTHFGLGAYAHVPGLVDYPDRALPLTGDERELRRRAWALTFTYAHAPTTVYWSERDPHLPRHDPRVAFPNAPAYAASLAGTGYRAPEARLNAIVDDIRADMAQIDGFQVVAIDVYANDALRLRDLGRLPASAATEAGVTVRIQDNRYVIEQTLVALAEKIAGYELALADAMLAGGEASRSAAYLEAEGIKRRAARLEADLRQLDARNALTAPPPPVCIEQSIARSC